MADVVVHSAEEAKLQLPSPKAQPPPLTGEAGGDARADEEEPHRARRRQRTQEHEPFLTARQLGADLSAEDYDREVPIVLLDFGAVLQP